MLDDIQCLLEQFKTFYDNKLTSVENDDKLSKDEILEMKLDISRAYISDLAEQNLNLIQTSALLRNETENRVKILDKLLGKTTEYLQEVNDHHNHHQIVDKREETLSVVRAKLKTVEKERNILKEYGAYLGRQVSALIHVITRARNTGSWDFSGTEFYCEESDEVSFTEKCSKQLCNLDEFNCADSLVSCSEEFGNCWTENSNKLYHRPASGLSVNFRDRGEPNSGRVTDRDVLVKRLQVDVKFLQKERHAKNLQLLAKDGTIAILQSQIIELKHELSLKENDCALHKHTFEQKLDEQRLSTIERFRNEEKVRRLKDVIENKSIICGHIPLTNSSTQTDNVPSEIMSTLERCDELKQRASFDNFRLNLRDKEIEIEQLRKEIFRLKRDEVKSLTENERDKYEQEILRLKDDLRDTNVSTQETRIILTREIAEKHDLIKNLREELAELNEHHKEIVQQLVLKSEVTKGLRKNLQLVESKLAENELEMTSQKVRFITQCELMDVQTTEIENQKITITNLREALVQSKRTNGNGISSSGGNTSNGTATKRNSTVREIFDI